MYVQCGFHCPPTYKQTTYKKHITIYTKTYTFPFQLSGKAPPKKERRKIGFGPIALYCTDKER